MDPAFLQFTFIIVAAALLSLLFRALKQPDILAFLLLGGLLSFYSSSLGLDLYALLNLFSHLGLTMLLFLVGLELTTLEIKRLGKPVLLLAISQMGLTFLMSFLLSYLIFSSLITSVYIGLALSFSSTVVILRLLSLRRDTQALYGRLSIGVLLVQDLVAVFALIAVATFAPGVSFNFSLLVSVIFKALFLFGLIIYLSQRFFPWLFSHLARDPEVLFLLGLAWALGLAAFVASPVMGFSLEIGGFLAGLALAGSAQHYQIAARMRPLRDLFIMIFFIFLGLRWQLSLDSSLFILAFWFSVVALLLKPLIVLTVLGLMGYRKRISFLTALSLGQISEFSLILVILGERLGHLSPSVVSLVTVAGAISMATSTVLIQNSERLYRGLSRFLGFFERKGRNHMSLPPGELTQHVVLIGLGRAGWPILTALKHRKSPILVVDTDPLILSNFHDHGVYFLTGDISDEEIQKEANLDKARCIISTATDFHDDLALLSHVAAKHHKAKVIVTAKTEEEAQKLYEKGAHYVLLPHYLSGQFLAGFIQGKKDFLTSLQSLRRKQGVC